MSSISLFNDIIIISDYALIKTLICKALRDLSRNSSVSNNNLFKAIKTVSYYFIDGKMGIYYDKRLKNITKEDEIFIEKEFKSTLAKFMEIDIKENTMFYSLAEYVIKNKHEREVWKYLYHGMQNDFFEVNEEFINSNVQKYVHDVVLKI